MNLTTSRLLGGPASSRWPKRSCPLRPSTVSKLNQTVSGATSATLTINPVGTGDAGTYTVVVANATAQVESTPATLAVTTPPTRAPVAVSITATCTAVMPPESASRV